MDHYLAYNDLVKKTDSIFAENEKIRERIHRMIGHSPLQVVERKDEREEIVRETAKQFRVVCRFLRDFIERNYLTRMKPFRSYAGLLEAYDLIERFIGSDVAPVAMEAIIAISLPGEKAPIQNLFRMFVYDDPKDDRIALKRLTIFINALEEAKRYREAKSTWSSDDQPLSVYYSGEFMTTEMANMEEMDDMLAAIRNEDTYSWYLKKVIYPLIMQKFENYVFNFDDIKHDSWKKVWERLKNVPEVGADIDITGSGKYSLENEDTIRMIIKDAITQYHSGTLYLYHPMWLFGSKLYWMVLDDYLRMFQQDFELFQMKQLMEQI